MSERDRGDRPKKSWRELDQQRGRPRPPRSEDRPRPDGMDARASKQYRAALDALFDKGEVGKLAEKLSGGGGRLDPLDVVRNTHRPPPAEPAAATPPATEREAIAPKTAPTPSPKEDGRAALRKKVVEALGRDEITRAVDRYVKAHGWPRDFEVLEQALEHSKPDRQGEAMAQLDQLLQRERPKRSRTLVGKLRFIEETSDSPELRQQAALLRAKL